MRNPLMEPLELPPLILASASPRRAALLKQLELDFEILSADIAEFEDPNLTPAEICQLNAYHKARAIAKQVPDALVLGADTVVCIGARIFGKPVNLEAAEETLGALQAKTHEVITGVCLLHLRRHLQVLFADRTSVTFKRLTRKQIREYLAKTNPLDKAGAYAIQEHGERIVRKISGSYSNVVGLPLEALAKVLLLFKLE